MTIHVGDRLPEATFMKMTPEGPRPVTSAELFKGRTVALFAVPGAFTPTCSAKHLPGFLDKAADFSARGVDEIVCVSVNDVFVMDAWGKAQGVDGKVSMLADGNGDFARAIDLVMEASKFGMGTRSQRFSMLVKDGVVEKLNVEAPGAFEVSTAEHLLSEI